MLRNESMKSDWKIVKIKKNTSKKRLNLYWGNKKPNGIFQSKPAHKYCFCHSEEIYFLFNSIDSFTLEIKDGKLFCEKNWNSILSQFIFFLLSYTSNPVYTWVYLSIPKYNRVFLEYTLIIPWVYLVK